MALAVSPADRCVETSTTTGTGDLTLAGALVGFTRFDDWFSVGDYCYYMIEAIDANGDATGQWEMGVGAYSATDTLTRTSPSNASAAPPVNFSAGTKRVSVAHSSRAIWKDGALVKKAADQTAANYTTAAAIAWDAETYDDGNYHDTVTNNSRLTAGIVMPNAQVSAQVTLASHTANKFVQLEIRKNGSASFDGYASNMVQSNTTTPTVNVMTPPLVVALGDYFEAFLTVETDTSITVTAAQSWFAIQRIL